MLLYGNLLFPKTKPPAQQYAPSQDYPLNMKSVWFCLTSESDYKEASCLHRLITDSINSTLLITDQELLLICGNGSFLVIAFWTERKKKLVNVILNGHYFPSNCDGVCCWPKVKLVSGCLFIFQYFCYLHCDIFHINFWVLMHFLICYTINDGLDVLFSVQITFLHFITFYFEIRSQFLLP